MCTRLTRLLAPAAVALFATLCAEAALAKGDTIVYVNGRTEQGVVVRETADEVAVRGRSQPIPSREVLRILHANAPTQYGKGESSLYAGQYREAIEAFEKAEQSESGDKDKAWVKPYSMYHRAEALRRWGAASGDKGKLSSAIELYERVIAEFGTHLLLPAAKYGLGMAMLASDRVGEASKELETVAQRKYGDFWELSAKLGKARCLLAEKSFTEALTEIESTIDAARGPGLEEIHVTAQVLKGETYMAKQDFATAIKFYEELASRGQGTSAQSAAGAYVNLARAYQGRNKDDDKRRALRTYMQVTLYYAGAPEAYAEALYATGKLLEEFGEKEYAKSYFRELKARCPDSSWAKKAP